jgi:hypothetical protein
MTYSPTSQLDRTVSGVYSGCSTEAGVLVLPCHGLVRSGVACFSSNRKSVIRTKYKPTPNNTVTAKNVAQIPHSLIGTLGTPNRIFKKFKDFFRLVFANSFEYSPVYLKSGQKKQFLPNISKEQEVLQFTSKGFNQPVTRTKH